MIPRVPLREALSDPNLLGTAIAGDSWSSWRTLLIAAMGEELREDEREIFSQLTGREHEPLQRVDQFAAVIGRRGGKSRAMATLACYIAGSTANMRPPRKKMPPARIFNEPLTFGAGARIWFDD